tara:strand:- start:2357 stop:3574 length:1218 start_codon:yes stop_codon:yes gene_type:complete
MANYALMNPGKYHLGEPFDFPPKQNLPFDDKNFISNVKWKTSVLLNTRVYIGNVEIVESDGTTRILSDSMFKSKSNKYDSFTLDRRIDVAVADGEEIVRLATFADRILQFKQNTLHIINATKNREFLESTHRFKGVSHHNAVIETDYGVAWCNQTGVYVYNGQQIAELHIKQGIRTFSKSAWEDFYIDGKTMIGYIPSTKQLLLIKSFEQANSDDILIYDMILRAWTKGTGRLLAKDKTNIVNIWDNNLVFGYENDTAKTTVVPFKPELDNNDSSTGDISTYKVQTRAMIFQTQAKKKVAKVRITYRGGNGANVNIVPKYAFDGGSFSHNFTNDAGATITGVTGDGSARYLNGSTNWTEIELNTGDNANGVRSFSIELANVSGQSVPHDFEINDITIIYRRKSVK